MYDKRTSEIEQAVIKDMTVESFTVANVTRILIVEDEMMIAILLEDVLRSDGFDIVGPVSSVSRGVQVAATETIDAAILDLNVAGEQVYPVAEVLLSRIIPFLFVTGYKASSIDNKFRNVPALQKPFKTAVLKLKLRSLLESAYADKH